MVNKIRSFTLVYTLFHPKNILIMLVPENTFFENDKLSYTLLVSGKELDNIGELSAIRKVISFLDFKEISDVVTSVVPVSTKDAGIRSMLAGTIRVSPGSDAHLYDSQLNNVFIKEAIIFHSQSPMSVE